MGVPMTENLLSGQDFGVNVAIRLLPKELPASFALPRTGLRKEPVNLWAVPRGRFMACHTLVTVLIGWVKLWAAPSMM